MSQETVVQSAVQSKNENVFAYKNYLLLLIATVFSAPGYYVCLMGSEWLMLSITESRMFFGLLFLGAAIPRLLFMTYGGILADRYNKKSIILISDISRALLVLILLLLVVFNWINPWHLVIISVLFGISDAFAHPASSSLVASLLPKDLLQKGNGYLQMVNQISPILGPVIGGSLIVGLGFTGVYSVALIMLLIASITIWYVSIKGNEEQTEQESMWNEFKSGLSYAKSSRLLVTIMGLSFVLNFLVTGPLAMGIPLLVKDIYGENALGLTVLQVSLGVGALLGAAGMVIFKNNKKPGLLSLTGLLGMSIFYILVGFSPTLFISALYLFIVGILLQLINIPIMTIIQTQTDPKYLGRVMSLLMTMATGLIPVSFFVTSVLLGIGISIDTIIKIGGFGLLVVVLFSFNLKELRNVRYSN